MKGLLSNILRPKTIDQVIGQSHLLGDNSLIKQMVKNKTLYSLIFYGYPGIGKSSISYALVNDLNVPYQVFNAFKLLRQQNYLKDDILSSLKKFID